MDPRTNDQFTQFLREKAAEAQAAIRYHPARFLGMLGEEGGFSTVNKLLAANTVSDGFTKLFMGGRLDLSIEALVVETKWRSYFDPDLVIKAEKKLHQSNYRFKSDQ